MKVINRCFIVLCVLAIIVTALGGMVIGFKMGKDSICGDIAFYYHNDLPVKGCVEKNPETRGKESVK